MSVRSALSPETRILLAAVDRDGGSRELGRLLEGDPEWERLLDLALRERSFPPVWRRLAPYLQGRSLEGTAEVFDRVAANWKLYLTILRRRLLETLDELEEAGIEVLLLKGAALAHRGYGHFTERPMRDLDLLVREGDAGRAWELLRREGWRWDRTRFPASPYREHHHLPPLGDERGSGARLEVHRGVLAVGHDFRFGTEDMWRGAPVVEIEGRRARVPSPVPHLIHLCLHFAWADRLGRGAWKTFRDADVLVRDEIFEWEWFTRTARAAGAERCCYWTLLLARELAGIAVPDDVVAALRPLLPGPVHDRLARHYALDLFITEPDCPSVRLRSLLWRTGVHPGSDRRERWPRDAETDRDDVASPSGTPEGRVDGWRQKLLHHFRSRKRWGRYLRSVLTGLR